MNIYIAVVAYNCEKTLVPTFEAVRDKERYHFVIVDDGSTDATADLARNLPAHVIRHEKNRGYGAAQKSAYAHALARGADAVVLLHADNQYDPSRVGDMLRPILMGECDIVFGSRMKDRAGARHGGMPKWRFVANILLTAIANMCLGTHVSDWHTGYRAYSAAALSAIRFRDNSDDYDFDVEALVNAIVAGSRLGEISIETRYGADVSSINFVRSVVYGFRFLKHVIMGTLRLWLHPRSR